MDTFEGDRGVNAQYPFLHLHTRSRTVARRNLVGWGRHMDMWFIEEPKGING